MMNQNVVQLSRKKSSDADFETQVDPVCKMLVQPASAAAEYEYRNKKY